MGKVSDLEKIGRDVDISEIDRPTRSRIELTIKKPTPVPIRESRPEKQLDVPVPLTLDDQGDIMAQSEAVPHPEVLEERIVAAPAAFPEIEVAAQVLTPAREARVEVTPPAKVGDLLMERPAVAAEIKTADKARTMTYAMMGVGLAMYIGDLSLTAAQVVGRLVGWGLIIIASALISLAIIRLLPAPSGKDVDEEELVLCPVCHEVVTDQEARCPSCGVKFEDTGTRK